MMRGDIGGIDLNLLWVLHVLLEERSATGAARRLHVTQSAVSGALRRLRDLFDDPLMVRTARGLAPTPFAVDLRPRLSSALATLGLVVRAERTPRTITIACTDIVAASIVPAVAARLAAKSPGTLLRLVSVEAAASDALADGSVDLLIGIPPSTPRGCEGETIAEDRLVCVVRANHPARGRMGAKHFTELPHVELALFGNVDDRVDRALARIGLERRVALTVPHLLAIPPTVAGTDCVATISVRLARAYRHLGLRTFAPPFAIAPLVLRQYWHRRTRKDDYVRLLRELVREAS